MPASRVGGYMYTAAEVMFAQSFGSEIRERTGLAMGVLRVQRKEEVTVGVVLQHSEKKVSGVVRIPVVAGHGGPRL